MPRLPGPRASHRQTLLDTVETLLMEEPGHRITLDEVAARAGITKSGLIYHFKSREALLVALVE